MRAIQITEFGGPEVLRLVDLPDPVAAGNAVVLQTSSAGVNFADTHQVEDSYLSRATLPLVPGQEVVGTLSGGRRVVAFTTSGGYAEQTLVQPTATFDLPDRVGDGEALALLIQGLTAWHLLRTSTHLVAGESVVVHAAAGGVGTLAIQLARAWGAGRIIGVASSPAKRALAESLGADATVDSGEADLKTALQAANGGRKVDIVLEMVGGPTFEASYAALAPFGRLATFGMAGRVPPAPLDAAKLMSHSRAVIGFWLAHCFGHPELLAPQMAELLSMVNVGTLTPQVAQPFALEDAAKAHEALRGRSSIGKLILDCKA